MANLKNLPISIEDFKELIDGNYYFVDKTLLIRDLIAKQKKVCLITRPRRFGKTLNMSMIQRFFEMTDQNNSNAYLFNGLKISECGEEIMRHQGQYPVITISLKSMKQDTYEDAFASFRSIISKEFNRHADVLKAGTLSPSNRRAFEDIYYERVEKKSAFNTSIELLSNCIYEATGKKSIILIDEYDVPLENSYFRQFYDEMVSLIRSVFESALKSNPNMAFAVLTGCLRVSKESIFTGLNNLFVYSVTKNLFSEYFGFTQQEVENIAEYYGISDRVAELKEWYDGYQFGETEIYNPWSILGYVDSVISGEQISCIPYWINTSSNSIIHELVIKSNSSTKKKIEALIHGGSVKEPIYEDSVYANLDVNKDAIWSFLLFTGYLKLVKSELRDENVFAEMVIPNREVLSIYKRTIKEWFNESVKEDSEPKLLTALLKEDPLEVQNVINYWLKKCISYYDTLENFYHGFLAGLLVGSESYDVKSNRENGDGRTDLTVCEYQTRSLAIIIEVKPATEFRFLEKMCDEALAQIRNNRYDEQMTVDCYQRVVRFGIAFYDKSCMVKMDADPV